MKDNAVSEITGYILILALVITAIGIIYLLAWPEIQNGQENAQVQNMEQSFTVLDLHASKAHYSSDLSQVTEMSLNGGIVGVNSSYDNAYIIIRREGYTDEVFNGTLGTVYYYLNGDEIAYQGGGVWRKYPGGGSVMISAPDFNYNGETLTLPLMQFSGNGSKSGTGASFITVQSDTSPVICFPNLSLKNGTNPLRGDNVYAIIKSDYYDAWARYINERTQCAATPDPATKTVFVKFNIKQKRVNAPLVMPISIKNINTSNDRPLREFSLNLTEVGSNLQMDIRAPSSSSDVPSTTPALHICLQKRTGGGTEGISITVQYSENGKTETFECERMCMIADDDTADINLIDVENLTTYTSHTTSWTWGSDPLYTDAGDFDDDANIPVNEVIQHYVVLMARKSSTGSFNLCLGSRSGDHWDGMGPSTYSLDYDSINVLTYLHVTSNKMNVEIA